MKNRIEWLVDDHVIYNKIYDFDTQSLADHCQMLAKMIDQSEHILVHTLWDLTEMSDFPKNVGVISSAAKPFLSDNKLGWVITVMDNQMVSFLATVATGMYSVRYRSFKTMDEAIHFLQQQDVTLPDIEVA